MDNKTLIYHKLEAFIRKYYVNQLLRGFIFFIGLSLIYSFFTSFIEYFLWLNSFGRTFLFYFFVLGILFLLVKFIFIPLFYLFKIKRGISYHEASLIIGRHFSDVNDKLLNFLQLSENNSKSELLIASIDQKASSLRLVPFDKAIDYSSNRRYLPLVLLPFLVFLIIYLSDNFSYVSQSFNRVLHFEQNFVKPAPFTFVLNNKNLQVYQHSNYEVSIKVVGNYLPNKVSIYINNESYFMQNCGNGVFKYLIENSLSDLNFHFQANDVISQDYLLSVFKLPSISNFVMLLQYPNYINKKSETIKGTGNAIIPEGTKVTWNLNAIATINILWINSSLKHNFIKSDENFMFSKIVNQSLDYQISTSNKHINAHDILTYKLNVIKDQYPDISVSKAPDSLKLSDKYLLGTISDDYGLKKLQVVYYPIDNASDIKRANLPLRNSSSDKFVFLFPSNLPVTQGVSYEYYFEIFDNDILHNYKSSKSAVFSDKILSNSEVQDQLYKLQNSNISSLSKSVKDSKKQLSDLDKIQKVTKEKENLEFKDKQNLTNFLERQKQQNELMKDFSDKLANNLKKSEDKTDLINKELQKRLEESMKDIEKNEKLLDELKSLTNKLKDENLLDKLDNLEQASKSQTKNLEQLVELTKKYYTEKKAKQISEKLDKLSSEQKKLSDNSIQNNENSQDKINNDFDQIKKDISDLQKQNKELKAPLDLPLKENSLKSIEDDLQKAKESLSKNNKDKAKPKQKSASEKMKEMSSQLSQSLTDEEVEQMEEDIKVLRQILDNLLAFSFSQEDLLKHFKQNRSNSFDLNKKVKIQQNLKQQFKYIDDSLFTLSSRNVKLTSFVTKEVGNIHYNLDKSIQYLVDAQLNKAISFQQYTISSANVLSDFLSNLLNSLQMEMSGMGSGSSKKPKSGQGDGMQLSDIIKKQSSLNSKIKGGSKEGDKPGTNPGKNPSSGNGGKGGNNGQDGEDGENGANEILKIYQEQRRLRESLQDALNKNGLGGVGNNAVNQMKQLEKQLLNKGFSNDLMRKSQNLNYELLKLEKAFLQQGDDMKRKSESNGFDFQKNNISLPLPLQNFINTTEILNRQSLPLQNKYNSKIQYYFKK